jgi:iron complex transport system substrate-binding protein
VRRVARVRAVAFAVGLLLAVSSPAGAFSARDMLGREVALAAPPARIVSLVPSVTEILYALGAEARLVGVTDFCDYPPAARAKASVGGMVNPNLEAIVALKPDLVIATTEGNREETFAQLKRLGVPTYLVAAHRVRDVADLIARLGALTASEPAAGALLARIERRVAAVTRAVASLPRLRVLYVLWPEPLIVPGREAHVTELIRLAGGESVTAGEADAYPRYSLESAVAKAPDVILLANHGANTGPIDETKWRRLTSLPAVRTGRLHRVDGNLVHRYGPRVVEGLEQIARAIHPEAFE